MATFTLTDKAKSDLKDIARFTQKRWGREQRNQYLKDLDACFFRLAGNPSLGRECSEVRTSYHKFPTGSHVIYYRSISKSQVVIVRILHESMDVEIQFTRRQEEPH